MSIEDLIHEKLKGNRCPNCRSSLDAATATFSQKPLVPDPEDLTICLYCQKILIFNSDLSLRVATAEDLGKLKYDTLLKLALAKKTARKVFTRKQQEEN